MASIIRVLLDESITIDGKGFKNISRLASNVVESLAKICRRLYYCPYFCQLVLSSNINNINVYDFHSFNFVVMLIASIGSVFLGR